MRSRNGFPSVSVGTGVYYPIPVHRQKPLMELGYGDLSFPVSEQLSEEVLSIPVHPGLTDDDVDAVIEAVNATAARARLAPRESGSRVSADDLRAAVIGLGSMGANHARVLNELAGVELVAVADLGRGGRRDAPPAGRIARGYAVGRRAPGRRASRPRRRGRADLAPPVDRRSRPWPPAPTSWWRSPSLRIGPQAEQMIAAAEAAGRILTVGHIERFNPAIRELSRRLDDGELGRVFQIRAARLGPFPARVRDVGVVVDLAPHDIDVMRFLLRAEPIRLYAETEQRIHTDHEDLFTGLIKFDSGAIGLLEINWLTPTKVRKLTVTGERGMYEADYLTQDLVFYANPDKELVAEGEMTRRAVQRREPLAVELSEFVAAVRDGGPPPVDPHDALVAMLLARAMVDAAARGAVIGADELAGIVA